MFSKSCTGRLSVTASNFCELRRCVNIYVVGLQQKKDDNEMFPDTNGFLLLPAMLAPTKTFSYMHLVSLFPERKRVIEMDGPVL